MPRIVIKNETNSGDRKGWSKLVVDVDASHKDGYAFIGRFLNDGEEDVEVGSVIIQKNPAGSRKHGWHTGSCYVIDENGDFNVLKQGEKSKWNWCKEFLSFRDLVAEAVNKSKEKVVEAPSVVKCFVVVHEFNPEWTDHEIKKVFKNQGDAEAYIADEQRKFNDENPGYHEIYVRWVIKEVELS